eukprot:Tbor_TRINITY_DN4833_c0_g1::TRINITY_DN4833_c0_g1_i1::g.1332::m.1332
MPGSHIFPEWNDHRDIDMLQKALSVEKDQNIKLRRENCSLRKLFLYKQPLQMMDNDHESTAASVNELKDLFLLIQEESKRELLDHCAISTVLKNSDANGSGITPSEYDLSSSKGTDVIANSVDLQQILELDYEVKSLFKVSKLLRNKLDSTEKTNNLMQDEVVFLNEKLKQARAEAIMADKHLVTLTRKNNSYNTNIKTSINMVSSDEHIYDISKELSRCHDILSSKMSDELMDEINLERQLRIQLELCRSVEFYKAITESFYPVLVGLQKSQCRNDIRIMLAACENAKQKSYFSKQLQEDQEAVERARSHDISSNMYGHEYAELKNINCNLRLQNQMLQDSCREWREQCELITRDTERHSDMFAHQLAEVKAEAQRYKHLLLNMNDHNTIQVEIRNSSQPKDCNTSSSSVKEVQTEGRLSLVQEENDDIPTQTCVMTDMSSQSESDNMSVVEQELVPVHSEDLKEKLKKYEENAIAYQNQVKCLEHVISGSELEIRRLHKSVTELENVNSHLNVSVSDLKAFVRELQTQLIDQAAALDSWAAKVADVQNKADCSSNTLRETEKFLSVTLISLKEMTDEVVRQKQMVEEFKLQSVSSSAHIARGDIVCMELRNEIMCLNETISQLNNLRITAERDNIIEDNAKYEVAIDDIRRELSVQSNDKERRDKVRRSESPTRPAVVNDDGNSIEREFYTPMSTKNDASCSDVDSN